MAIKKIYAFYSHTIEIVRYGMNFKITSNINTNYNTHLSFKGGNNPIEPNSEGKNSNNRGLSTFGVAAAAISAAAIGGIAFTAGKNKVPAEVQSVIKAADECLNTANGKVKQIVELAINLQKKVDEVCALFENGGKDSSGKVVGKIIPNTDNTVMAENFLEEYTAKGTLFRRSSFIDNSLIKIEEFADNGKIKNALNRNWFEGGIESYAEEYGKLADGSEGFARKIQFFGETNKYTDSAYDIDCLYNEVCTASGTKNIELKIENGKVKHYFEDYNKNTEANQLEIGRGIWLDYAGPNMYVESNTISKKGLENVGKELNFEDGKPVKCTFNSKEIEDGVMQTDKIWELQGDTWVKTA